MNDEERKAYALDHVICGGGNCTAQGPCWYDEICPTLKAAGPHSVALVNHEEENTN